jgi:hypothetical protein
MNTSEKQNLRAAWLHVLEKCAPNYFLTFNFGYEIRAINADRPMRTFFNVIQRKTYGRDWASQFDRDWPVAYGFLEHADTNPHFHVLARVSFEIGETLQSQGDRIWKGISRRGQLQVEEILSPDRVRSYCTKRQDFENVFVYSDTRPRVIR